MSRRFNTCRSKVRYSSWQSASDASLQLIAKGDFGIGPYQCLYCLGFHVGHKHSWRDWNVGLERSKKDHITWQYKDGKKINRTAIVEVALRKHRLKKELRDSIPNLETFGRILMQQEHRKCDWL